MIYKTSLSRRGFGLAAAALLLAGSAVTVIAQDRPLLGAVQMVAEHEWFRTIEMGMQAAADELGAELLVANAQGQVDREAEAVDNIVARGAQAVIISALDSQASIPALQRAVDTGAVLINYNSTIDSPLMTTFVGVDNTELGAQMGRYVAQYVVDNLGGEAQIALVTIPRYDVGRQRREGFVAALSEVPGIEIVAEQEGELPEQAASTIETILQANPELDIVWAANEGGLVGALTAKASTGADIAIFGTDMSLQTANALLDPNSGLMAVSTQDPYNIGYRSVELALAQLAGEETDAQVEVPLALYTADDAAAVQAYLDQYQALANR
jgi:ABC-type sugar transport system substrate-binding protein